jgi:DNA sulfur modification protein DndC
MEARADTSLVGKTLGWISVDAELQSAPAFRDNWRDMVSESACRSSVPVPEQKYRSAKGVRHDSLAYGDAISAKADHLQTEGKSFGILWSDLMWWYAMDFAAGTKSHAAEMNWLLREGLIQARPGYQASIAKYQQFGRLLADLGLQNARLGDIKKHPAFIDNGESAEQFILELAA